MNQRRIVRGREAFGVGITRDKEESIDTEYFLATISSPLSVRFLPVAYSKTSDLFGSRIDRINHPVVPLTKPIEMTLTDQFFGTRREGVLCKQPDVLIHPNEVVPGQPVQVLKYPLLKEQAIHQRRARRRFT